MFFLDIKTEKDLQTIQNLYQKHEKLLLSIAYSILHNNYLAEDAVHDTFIKIIQNLEKLNLENEYKTRGLVSIICRNISYDHYKKTYVNNETENLESLENNNFDYDNPLEIIVKKEIVQTYYDKIKELKPLYRDVLYLKYYYELDNNEIAKLLGISSDTIRKRIERAKKELFKKGGEKYEK